MHTKHPRDGAIVHAFIRKHSLRNNTGSTLLVVNVDDIVIIGSDNKRIDKLKIFLHTKF